MVHGISRFKCHVAIALVIILGACSCCTPNPRLIVRRYMEDLDRSTVSNRRQALMKTVCAFNSKAKATVEEVLSREYYGIYQLADDPYVDAAAMRLLMDTLERETECVATYESGLTTYFPDQGTVVWAPRFPSDSTSAAYCDCILQYYLRKPVYE